MMRSMSRAGALASSPGGPPPALFTSTSRRPCRAVISAYRRASASASRTSQALKEALRPCGFWQRARRRATAHHHLAPRPAGMRARCRRRCRARRRSPGPRRLANGSPPWASAWVASYGVVCYFQSMHADRPATLPRVLARAAQVFGDAPAIIEGAQRLSFRELESPGARRQRRLHQRGNHAPATGSRSGLPIAPSGWSAPWGPWVWAP